MLMSSLLAVFLASVFSLGLFAVLISATSIALASVSALASTSAFLARLVQLDIFRPLAASLRKRHLLYHLLQELLNLLEPEHVLFVDEGDGSTVAVGTCCTTDAVNVIFGIVRHVIIDNHLDVVDVDTTSHDVGSHEHVILTALELEHHIITLSLLQV